MIKYLAGIFDAEGYVRIRKTKCGSKFCYTPEVRIYMTNKAIVELFSNKYNVPIKQDFRGKCRKVAYHITFGVKFLKSTNFISDLLPFLNEKRVQLEQVKFLLKGFDKEQCYQDYMLAKTSFNHPVQGKLSNSYLAGIIDGDGWLSMFNAGGGRGFYNNYSVGLQQRYRPMIEYMTQFGGSNVTTCKVYDYQSHIQTYSWQCTTVEALPLLEVIEPYLIEKKQRCQILIRYIKEHEKFKKYSTKVLAEWKQ